MRRAAGVGAHRAHAADQHRHLRRREGQELRLVDQHLLGGDGEVPVEVVAEPVGLRLQRLEALGVGPGLLRVHAAGREGHRDVMAARARGRFHRRGAAEHDEVRQRDPLATRLRRVEMAADALQHLDHVGEAGGLVGLPVLLRREAHARAVGAPALVRDAERRGRGPGRQHEVGHRESGAEDARLERGDVGIVRQRMVDRRDRVLPDQVLPRHLGAEIERFRPHVAMRQLEPRARVGVGEKGGVLVIAPGDPGVVGVDLQGDVRRRHHRRVPGRGIVRVGHGVGHLAASGAPLMRAGRASRQLELVAEQHVEIAHVPGRRRRRPGALDARGGGVHAVPGLERVLPAEALVLDRAALGLGSHHGRIARAVRLAERVPAGDQGDGLLVVHRHAGEGVADVVRASLRVGLAVRPLGIDVDQPHLHRRERVLEEAAQAVPALVVAVVFEAEPLVLHAPVDVLLGLEDVLTPAGEAEGLKAHRLLRDVARQDEQVGPADRVAVFPLDRPEQAPRLVEVAVVRPRVKRGEALRA